MAYEERKIYFVYFLHKNIRSKKKRKMMENKENYLAHRKTLTLALIFETFTENIFSAILMENLLTNRLKYKYT